MPYLLHQCKPCPQILHKPRPKHLHRSKPYPQLLHKSKPQLKQLAPQQLKSKPSCRQRPRPHQPQHLHLHPPLPPHRLQSLTDAQPHLEGPGKKSHGRTSRRKQPMV
ncbi:pleckstrin homology-like domain family A member 1 [Cheilinus undulatus]|uniref:pleckstrin homology-like domain family A member 1 n=1 Tax=Cheilinus undulatus TaxID=241271 RepID=UPI001BD35382|nr:pleckstrin homology-like domain family A member 1 [Cheilinus undulatus]